MTGNRSTYLLFFTLLSTATMLVSCGGSSSSNKENTPIDPNPVAIVVDQLEQYVGTIIQLDATKSLPPSGGNKSSLTYSWTLDAKPTGSTATLDDSTLAQPRFTADEIGEYKASVVVSYDDKNSEPKVVTITINKANAIPIPVAKLSTSAPIYMGQTVVIDGRDSHDDDFDTLQYRWSLTKPIGSKAELINANTSQASFVPDAVGKFTAILNVYDGTSLNISPASVVIDVVKNPSASNAKPVAVIATPGSATTFEVEKATFSLRAVGSYDAEDGDIGTLRAQHEWTLLSAPNGFNADENFNKPACIFQIGNSCGVYSQGNILNPEYGDYKVQLRVKDSNDEWSDPVTATYTVINGANRPPKAIPILSAAGNVVATETTVTLSGTDGPDGGDPDGDRLTFQWAMIDRPDGSQATLSNANTQMPTFYADQPGSYSVSLVVTDSHGFSSEPTALTIMARAKNHVPLLRGKMAKAYDKEQPLVIGIYSSDGSYIPTIIPDRENYPLWNTVELITDGYDPDGDRLTYLWVRSEGPQGARFDLPVGGALPTSNFCTNSYFDISLKTYREWLEDQFMLTTCSTRPDVGKQSSYTLAPVSEGDYLVELQASDGIAFTESYTFEFSAVERENYPTLLMEQDESNVGSVTKVTRQKLFPYDVTSSSLTWSSHFSPSTDYILGTYQLTAYDRDYTLVDVAAVSTGVSAGMGHQVRFDGISENTVIRKGETVEFTLVLTTPTTLKNFATEYPGVMPNTQGDGISWSFRVAEKAGWTFKHIPHIW